MLCRECGREMRVGARFCPWCGTPARATTSVQRLTPLPIQERWSPPSLPADIVFVLDTTGSMDDEIDGLIHTCTLFADEIAASSIDYRLGLIGFGDLLIGEEMTIYPLTRSANKFKEWVTNIPRTGGGDEPESSLDAVREALTFEFRPDAQKVLILITDASPHDPDTDGYSATEITNLLRESNVLAFCITPSLDCWQQMADATGGEWFEIQSDTDFVSIIGRLAESVATGVTIRLTQRLQNSESTHRNL